MSIYGGTPNGGFPSIRGLLTPEERQQAMYQGLLNVGGSLLAAGSPTLRPGAQASFMSQIGPGWQAAQDSAINQKFAGAEMQGMMDQQARQAQMGEMVQGLITPDMDPNQAAYAQMFPQEYLSSMFAPGEGFTLGEDQVRYDSLGNVIASGPEGTPDAPKIKDFYEGGRIVQKQWDGSQWVEVGSGPRWNPSETGGADDWLGGKGLPNQLYNQLDELAPKISSGGWEALTADEQRRYSAAYNNLAQPSVTFDQATGIMRQVTPDMSAFPAPGGGASAGGAGVDTSQVMPERLTDTQLSAGGYATRADEANAALEQFSAQGMDYWNNRAMENIPFGLGNYAVSPEFQQFDQAARNFVNATLREESGAVISEEEFQNAAIQYFPQPGDSPEVIAQKAQNREDKIMSLVEASRPEYSGSPYRNDPAVRDWLSANNARWRDVIYTAWKNDMSVEQALRELGAINGN